MSKSKPKDVKKAPPAASAETPAVADKAAEEKAAAEKRTQTRAAAIASDKADQKEAAEKRAAADKAAEEKAAKRNDELKKQEKIAAAKLASMPRIAEGCSVTSLIGIIPPGHPVKPKYFSQDPEEGKAKIEEFIDRGIVIPGKK